MFVDSIHLIHLWLSILALLLVVVGYIPFVCVIGRASQGLHTCFYFVWLLSVLVGRFYRYILTEGLVIPQPTNLPQLLLVIVSLPTIPLICLIFSDLTWSYRANLYQCEQPPIVSCTLLLCQLLVIPLFPSCLILSWSHWWLIPRLMFVGKALLLDQQQWLHHYWIIAGYTLVPFAIVVVSIIVSVQIYTFFFCYTSMHLYHYSWLLYSSNTIAKPIPWLPSHCWWLLVQHLYLCLYFLHI